MGHKKEGTRHPTSVNVSTFDVLRLLKFLQEERSEEECIKHIGKSARSIQRYVKTLDEAGFKVKRFRPVEGGRWLYKCEKIL